MPEQAYNPSGVLAGKRFVTWASIWFSVPPVRIATGLRLVSFTSIVAIASGIGCFDSANVPSRSKT